jgi:hypothetical protein
VLAQTTASGIPARRSTISKRSLRIGDRELRAVVGNWIVS